MQRIYLDYAAGTPVDPRVLRAMEPYFREKFGNPGSLHSFGQEAMAAVDFSRETIARAVGAEFREIVFTGSATEANNLALRGVACAAQKWIKDPRIIVSSIEHESVLETARDLARTGIEAVYLPVDANGIIDLAALKKSLNERTVLVSVMHANNETGIIQPIREIAQIISDFKHSHAANPQSRDVQSISWPLFHTDAAQAFQFLNCNVDELGVDLMSLSAHKIYGPKGVGALYMRNKRQETRDKGRQAGSMSHVSFNLSPIVTGGGQEFGFRSGTENVPLIVGFAEAVQFTVSSRGSWNKKIEGLRSNFLRGLKAIAPHAKLNGEGAPTLPHIVNIHFSKITSEDIITYLDIHGIAVSSGSACRSRSLDVSHVLLAMGVPKEHVRQSVRISFGRMTTPKEIDKTLVIIKNMIKRLGEPQKGS